MPSENEPPSVLLEFPPNDAAPRLSSSNATQTLEPLNCNPSSLKRANARQRRRPLLLGLRHELTINRVGRRRVRERDEHLEPVANLDMPFCCRRERVHDERKNLLERQLTWCGLLRTLGKRLVLEVNLGRRRARTCRVRHSPRGVQGSEQ
jgi:hypothetical protein